MGIFNRRITEADLERVRREASQEATLVTQFANHQAQCSRDKDEIKKTLDNQDRERKELHRENTAKFDKIDMTMISIQRQIWVASGAVSVIVLLLTIRPWEWFHNIRIP